MTTHPDTLPDYVTFDGTVDTPTGPRDLVILASYQRLAGREMVELVEAIDEWGTDALADLKPHEYEHLRLTALSLFHCPPEERPR